MATERRHRVEAVRGFLLVVLLAPVTLAGCSVFRRDSGPSAVVTTPETPPDTLAPVPASAAAPARTPSRNGTSKRNGSGAAARTTTPAPATAPIDTTTSDTPELTQASAHRPTVSTILSAGQRTQSELQYRTDLERANQALDSLRGRTLTDSQVEQRASAERFLSEGRAAFETSDLPRAASLAMKARVLAEELKSATSPN